MKEIKSRVNVIYSFDRNNFCDFSRDKNCWTGQDSNGEDKSLEKYYVSGYQRTLNFEVFFTPINRTQNNQLRVERKILNQVIENYIDTIGVRHELDYLSMISIHYFDISDEQFEENCGFIMRSKSKYFFQPDQRDLLEDIICKDWDISSETETYDNYLDLMLEVKMRDEKVLKELGDNIVKLESNPKRINDFTFQYKPQELRLRKF